MTQVGRPLGSGPPAPPARSVVARSAGIEGLRGVAALSVLAYHVWFYAPGPRPPVLGAVTEPLLHRLSLGVTLFFALSGFLLWRPVAAAVTGNGPLPSARNHLRNRALRILPAYWVILLVTATVGATVVGWFGDGPTLGVTITDPVFLLRNALLLQSYHADTLYQGIGPAWSLTVEVVFYVAVPALAVLARAVAGRTGSVRRRTAAALLPAVVLLVVGVSGKLVAARLAGDRHELLLVSFWGCADLFAFGMAVAVVHGRLSQSGRVLPSSWRWWGPLVVVTAASAAQVVPFASAFHQTVMAVVFALLLAAVTLPTAGPGRSTWTGLLERRPLALAGVVSYSLYLWHEPLVHMWNSSGFALAGAVGYVVNLVVVGVAALVLASLTYRFVERPALRRKVAATPAWVR